MSRGECSKELTCQDLKTLYNKGKIDYNFLCKQCGKIKKRNKSDFCSSKCYDKYRYVNNINGRKDKLEVIEKLRKNRRHYIKNLSTTQLIQEIESEI